MKAEVLVNFSEDPYSAFSLQDFEEPKNLPPDFCLIRVKAVSINHIDIWQMKGKLYSPKLPHIPGSDISGIVEKGDEIGVLKDRGIREGDEVLVKHGVSCGMCYFCSSKRDSICKDYKMIGVHTSGGFAEFVPVPAKNVYLKPKNLSFEEASTIPLVSTTVFSMIRKVLERETSIFGKVVLVPGGGSGLGVVAIQYLKILKAKVITTVGSEEKIEKAKNIADIVLNHSYQDWWRGLEVDIVLDWIGERFFPIYFDILKRGGILVSTGMTTGNITTLDIRKLYAKEITVFGNLGGGRVDFELALSFFSSGEIKPYIWKVFPLQELPYALKCMMDRKHFGKIVIKI